MPTLARLIAGNWKMCKTAAEARTLAQQLRAALPARDDREYVVFPPFTSVPVVAETLAGSPVAWGGQNLHWEKQGAFTGEVSAAFLVELGCRYVLVGHSERRTLFGETDATSNRKVHAAVNAGLRPVLCCGETLAERERDDTFDVLSRQLQDGLAGLADPAGLVVAYEPVWAIGTGRNANPAQVAEVHSWTHDWLERRFPAGGDRVRVIYGGSVKPENAADLLGQEDVDGVLVGGASLDAAAFARIAAPAADRPQT